MPGGRWPGEPSRNGRPRLIGLYGAGLMAAGLFRADPADGFGPGAPAGKAAHISWHGDGHLIAASIGFIALIAACFVDRPLPLPPGAPGLAIYSRITGIAFLAALHRRHHRVRLQRYRAAVLRGGPRRLRLARRRLRSSLYRRVA